MYNISSTALHTNSNSTCDLRGVRARDTKPDRSLASQFALIARRNVLLTGSSPFQHTGSSHVNCAYVIWTVRNAFVFVLKKTCVFVSQNDRLEEIMTKSLFISRRDCAQDIQFLRARAILSVNRNIFDYIISYLQKACAFEEVKIS